MLSRLMIFILIVSNFVIRVDVLKSSEDSNDIFLPNNSVNYVNFNLVINETVNSNLSRYIFGFNRTKIPLVNNRNVASNNDNLDEVKNVNNYFNDLILTKLPPFDLSSTIGVSSKCQHDGAEYLKHLHNFTFWAIKMYDSSAKLSSGILSGNVNQLGDFDECLNTNSEDANNISGKYCLAFLQIDPPKSKYLKKMYTLIHSYFAFRSTLDDPGHRVPRFSSINWALCVPSSCSHTDVELALKASLKPMIDKTGFSIQIRVDKEMCQTNEKPMPWSTIIGLLFFSLLILHTIAATIYDYINPNTPDNFYNAFSLIKNIKIIFSLKPSNDDISSVHGIRLFNAIMLMMAHKSLAVFFIPKVNRTPMVEIVGRPWTVLGRAASLYTDPFLMISGMLTAYSYFGKLNRGKQVNIIEEILSRLLRIVPPLAGLILFCTLIAPWLSSGPQWNLVVTHHSDICKSYWWRNLLFIHNYFGFENMCLTHTHHVGIDTQLFLVAPLFIWILWKWRMQGVGVLLFIATLSTIWRYYVTYTMQLSNFVYFGTSITKLFQTANNMYTLPVHRVTVYLIGILLGYTLRNLKKVPLKSYHLNIGHAIAIACHCAAFYGPSYMGSINYKYRPIDGACYAAFAPICWCLSFAWIIFTDYFGYQNWLTKLLSMRWFLISTRLSYGIYLTQFPVYFFNVGRARNADYYNFFSVMLNFQEYLCIILCSVVLTLFFDTPFQNIKKILFKRDKNAVVVEKKEDIILNGQINMHQEKLKDL